MAQRKAFGEYSFVAVTILVGVLTVGLLVLGLELHWGAYAYLLVLIPIGIAGAYLVSFSKVAPRPALAPPAPAAAPSSASTDEEPFVDPVEEADRIASGEELPPRPD